MTPTLSIDKPVARGWTTAILLLLVSLLSYLDRNTLAVLAPTILADTHLTNEQYGWIISSFSVAYMIGNPVWGVLLDRAGITRGLAIAVAIWTAASTAHAFVATFIGFAVARALLGFAEGATFPAGLRGVVETLPDAQRSRGTAVAFSGGSLGAVITPLVVTPIALRFGWHVAFLFTGIAGLIWLTAWLAYRSRFANVRSAPAVLELPGLLEPRFWALVCAYALGAAPLITGIYVAPLYLSRVMDVDQKLLGKLLFIPPLGWEVGYFFWGWIADRMYKKGEQPVKLFVMLAVLSLPLIFMTALGSVAAVMVLFFFSMFIGAGFVIMGMRYGVDVYGLRHAALAAGIAAGSWSALVAVIMPLIGRLFDHNQYGTAYTIVALIPVAGVIGWWVLARFTRSATPLPDQSS